VQALVQSGIDHVYADFIAKTAQARKLEVAQVDELAQGRIWTGAQAQAHRLVDQVGTFNDAVEAARQLAGQSDDKALPIKYRGPKVSKVQRWVQQFLMEVLMQVDAGSAQSAFKSWAQGCMPGSLAEDLIWLQTLTEHTQAYTAAAHCLCQITP
jgi:protease-4